MMRHVGWVITLPALLLLTAAPTHVQAYQSDYDLTTLVNILLTSYNLTVNALFRGPDNTSIAQDVTFWCGTPKNKTLQQTFLDDVDIKTKLNFSLPIAFVIHGYIDNVNRTWVQSTIRDYLTFYDSNVCGVDWSRLAMFDYVTTAQVNVDKVAGFLAEFIRSLNSTGIPLGDVTLAGHSLGAHIAGIAGGLLGGKIGRIFGMDPAGPLFTYPLPVGEKYRLDKSDAQFVQNIYTSSPILGGNIDMGHQNFYPNGGIVPQPFCIFPTLQNGLAPESITCSHIYATVLFRYSLNPRNSLQGVQCPSTLLYLTNLCMFNVRDVIGPNSKRIPGNYYLNTLAYPS